MSGGPPTRERAPRTEVTCYACGTRQRRYTSQVRLNTSGRFFCSGTCRKRVGSKPRRGSWSPCARDGCDARVYSPPRERRLYCSRRCADVANRRGRYQQCPGCGDRFWVRPSVRQIYCTRACRTQAVAPPAFEGRYFNGEPVRQDPDGYLWLWVPEHPRAFRGYVAEHRYVVEQRIGRHLRTDEHVHHINGVKWDNRDENLTPLSAGEHTRITVREATAARRAAAAELVEYRRRFGPLGNEAAS